MSSNGRSVCSATRGRGRRILPSLLAVTLVPLMMAAGPGTAAAAPVAASDGTTIAPAKPLLGAPQHGSKAIRRLGDQLDVAADRNDLRPAELRTMLRTDATVWVDTRGTVFYVDPAPGAAAGATESPAAPVAPLSDTFSLHSNPGANLTILLDFDGAEVSGTAWNAQSNVTPGAQPAWDPAGDGPAFSDGERAKVQQVWAMVAEDYAPFGVDVTTQDPGDAALVRSSSDDSVYGTRVLVTPSDDPFLKICNRACGGVAYLSVFDSIGTYTQPAWIFPQALGNDAKNVAEAAAHEAGHNLGLNHDGTSTEGYYGGHGVWAPIMGVGYYRPLVQWSRGSYTGANNQQDDLQTLTGYLGARPDEAPSSPATPATLPSGEAVIGTSDDVDAYLLGSCAAGAAVDVLPAAVAPDLDVRAVLYDAGGTQRAASQPVSGSGDGTTASGLGGSLTVPADGEGWVVTVEGVGEGAWPSSGYDDYGSLGAYTVHAPGCDGDLATGVPSAPRDVAVGSPGLDSLTLSWTPPAATGDGPVTGYVVTRSGSASSQTLGADARSHTFTGLAAGTSYQLSVQALNATGAGPSVMVSASTQDPAPQPPSSPRNVTGSYDQATGVLHAWWTEPADVGTQPVSGYAIYLDGSYLGQLDATSRGVDISRTTGFAEGQYVVGIAAVNAVGSSPAATTTITVDLPDRPANDGISSAQLLPGHDGSVAGDNTYATGEPTDPTPPSAYTAGGHSVWYSWTPADDGPVTMGTSGGAPDRDTTLAAYSGQPGALVLVAGADDSVGLHAAISFDAVAGTRYLVAVDGFDAVGGTGPFTLSWSQQLPTAPAAPTSVSARPADGSASVTWSAAEPHGSPITKYTVVARTAGQADHTTTVDGSGRSATVTGLTNGTEYAVTVTATNAKGVSPESDVVRVVPDVPDTSAPVIGAFAASARQMDPFFHSGSVTVRVRLSDDRGISGSPVMNIGPRSGSGTGMSAPLSLLRGDRRDGIWAASFLVPGDASSGSWSAWTTATDAQGNTTSVTRGANAVFQVLTDLWLGEAPASPSAVTAVPGDGRARVSWSAPAGSATDYTVWVSPGVESVTVAGTQRSALVGGLDDDTSYTFTVVAGNAVGESAESTPSATVTPRRVPTAPTDVTAAAGDGSATVTWKDRYLPEDVSSYRLTATSAAGDRVTRSVVAGVTSTPFTGLTNGTAYTFTVAARNAAGDSPESQSSNVAKPAGVPLRPGAPSAVRGDGLATVSWAAVSGNGSPVTGYTVSASPGGGTCSTSGALSCTVQGLSNGTAYTFSVSATNAVGVSAASAASSAVTPAGVPSKPGAPSGVRGDREVTVSWAGVSGNGSPVTGYTVTASPGGGTCSTSGALSCTVQGLSNGTAYTFSVSATNAVGMSSLSAASPSVTPAAVPSKPGAPSAVRGDGMVTVSWAAVSGNGSPVTGYTVTASPGGNSCSTTGALSCTVQGLSNGTAYTFTVSATNAVGVSAASAASSAVTPAGVPSKPGAPLAVRGDREVTVSWAGVSGNGSPVTGYTVTASPGGFTCSTSVAWSCTVPGLSNGTAYTFTVVATNAVGVSPESQSSNVAKPAGVPLKPEAPSAVRGDGLATVSWAAAAGNGSPVTGYAVTASPGGHSCSTTGALSCTVPGLSNGTAYTFTVVASNAVGVSPVSGESSSVTPAGVPFKPGTPSAVRGDREATVSWTAVSGNGSPVTGYTVAASPGGHSCSTTGALSCTVPGLSNGTAYTFRVAAVNAVGESAVSAASAAVTPAGVPTKPGAPSAVRGDRGVRVSWAAVSGNGSPVTGYTVTASPGGSTCSTTGALSCTVQGLANGTAYTFTVMATNAVGVGPLSATSPSVTPAGVPTTPGTVAAVAAGRRATVTWASAEANGSPVTRYLVDLSVGKDKSVDGTIHKVVLKQLKPGRYKVRVAAVNEVGTSPYSSWVKIRIR